MLDKAVLVYAKMGITQSDARIATWKAKYIYNLLRPITYIRSVIEKPTWNFYISTPNHPEYPSAHSSFSTPAAIILTKEFGDHYAFSDLTYEFLGLPPRSFSSFYNAAKDAGESRVAGGLHYKFAIDAGVTLEHAIVQYMNEHVNFKK